MFKGKLNPVMLKTKLLLIFIILAYAPISIKAQQNDLAIVGNLNKVIKPIYTFRGDTDFIEIDFLKETLKNKEVIALGEVTHGTAEVFDYKDRLVRYLVTHLDYKAIAFESDFLAIEYIDSYITGKVDSIKYVAGTNIMRINDLMIEWLRQYNRDKSDADKVRLVSIVLPGNEFHPNEDNSLLPN